jgi:hypothetical protein
MTNSKKSRIGEMIKEEKIYPFTDRIWKKKLEIIIKRGRDHLYVSLVF